MSLSMASKAPLLSLSKVWRQATKRQPNLGLKQAAPNTPKSTSTENPPAALAEKPLKSNTYSKAIKYVQSAGKEPTILLSCFVKPVRKKETSRIVSFQDDSPEYNREILKLVVNKPPIQDKANRAIIKLLSETLGVSKSDIKFVTGRTSHNKVVAITGNDVREKGEAYVGRARKLIEEAAKSST